MSITIKARVISKGIGEGEAIVCKLPIGFNFGVNVENGVITEHNHPLENRSIKDKVLIFPHGKGSTGGSYVLYQLAKMGTGPKAIINMNTETIIAVGAIMGGIPVVDRPDQDILSLIEDGDYIKVVAGDGAGVIEISKRAEVRNRVPYR